MADPAAPPAEVRPEAPPKGTPVPLDQWFQSMMSEADARRQKTFGEAKDYLSEREAALAGPREAVVQASQAPMPSPPMPPPQIQPPTPGITPFAEGMPGESSAQTLNRTLMALGLMAQMGVGLAKGNPSGALSSYTGALRGWQEGAMLKGQQEWQEYLTHITSMQRAYQNAHQMYEDIVRQNLDNVERRKLELGIAAAKQDEKQQAVDLAFRNDQAFMDQVKLTGTMLERMYSDANRLSFQYMMRKDQQDFQRNLEEQRHRDRVEEAKERERIRREERPVNAPAGGEWYDKKTKERGIAVVQQGDINADPRRYAKISPQEKTLLDFIDTTPPMLNRIPHLVEKILTQYPGQNIANTAKLAAEGKLGMSDELREFVSINRALTVEATRILGGGGQLRIGLLKRLENEVTPRVQDTVSTAMTAQRLMHIDFENRKRGILGEPQLQYSDAVGGKWVVTDGKQQRGITLKDNEILSESHPGWTVVKPYVAPEQK